ncbi:MAG: hypothetical protein AAGE94_12735 [Acidobacteriota bacterium]
MDYAWHDLVGNIGVVLIVGTYLAVQLDRLDARGIGYSVTNFLGAGMILVSLAFDFNLSSVVIEAFWAAISLIGIARWWRQRSSPAADSPAEQDQLGAEARAHGQE